MFLAASLYCSSGVMAQRALNCNTVNSLSATNTSNDIMTRLQACVNLLGTLGGGIADARDMNAFYSGAITPPSPGIPFTLGAKNVTLLLGNYTIVFTGSYPTTPPITIPVAATGFSIIGLGGGGRSGAANSVFDFSGVTLPSTTGAAAAPASMITSNCPSACTFAGFRILGNIAQSPSNTTTPLTGSNGFATGGAAMNVTLDDVDVVNSSNNGVVLGLGTMACTDCTVRNSYVSKIWQTGVVAVNVTNFKALNNVVLDTALSIATYPGPSAPVGGGFGIHTLGSQAGDQVPSSYVVIKDNYVGTSATGSGAANVCISSSKIGCNQGIQADSSVHCTIADNYLVNTQKESIAVSCTDVVVQGNHIYNQVWPNPPSGIPGQGCVSVFGSAGTGSPLAAPFAGQFIVRDNICNINVGSLSTQSAGYVVQLHNGSAGNGGGFVSLSNGVVSGNIGTGNFLVGLQLTLMDTANTYQDSDIIVHDNSWFSSNMGAKSLGTSLASGTQTLSGNLGWWGNRDNASTVSVPNPNMSGTGMPTVALTFSEAAVAMQESAAPPFGSGIDALWGDSATHALMMNPNNSAASYKVEGLSGGFVAGGGTLPKFDTNGFFVDSGIQNGNIVQMSRNINTTSPLTGGGSLVSDLTLVCSTASSFQSGCLTSTDWATFNAKAPTASPTFTTAINTPVVQVNGSTFTTSASGCSVTGASLTGGATAGTYKINTGGTECAVTLTMGGGASATHGWACSINNLSGATQHQTGTTTTTAIFSGQTVAMDVLVFACTAY